MSYKEQLEQARKDKATTELSAKYVKFEKKGDSILGSLLGKNQVAGSLGSGNYFQYLFDTDDGLVKCALGQATDGEAGALMVIGGIYSITFQGQEKLTGGRKINRFEVLQIAVEGGSPVGSSADVPF